MISSARATLFRSMKKGTVVVVLSYLPLSTDEGISVPGFGDLGVVVNNREGCVNVLVQGKHPRGRSSWGFFYNYTKDDLWLATVEEAVAMELMDQP